MLSGSSLLVSLIELSFIDIKDAATFIKLWDWFPALTNFFDEFGESW